MQSFKALLGTVLFSAMVATACNAAERSTEPAIKDNMRVVSARVEAIDPATRVIRLNGAEGPADIVVPPEVRNLDQIRVGDTVQVSYYTGIAAQIKKAGDPVTVPSEEIVSARAEPGAKPGAAVGHNITTTVSIEAVDTKLNTVTFKRPDGSIKALAVESPEGQKFIKTLRKGDQVDIVYTEAVAVEVVAGEKK